jgi:hypothetical protein
LIVKNSHFATMEFSRCARASARPTRATAPAVAFNSRRPGLSKLSSESCTRRGRR